MSRRTLWEVLKERLSRGPAPAPSHKPQPKPDPAPTPGPGPQPQPEPAQRAAFLAGVKARVGGRFCTPPRSGCTDCSGLICEEYRRATGRELTCDSHAQFRDLRQLGIDGIRPGDLVFWDTGFSQRHGNRASHVGVFVGGGMVVNAFNEGRGVVETKLDANYGGPFLGARQLVWMDEQGQPLPSQPRAITASSDFRALPAISEARVCEILRGYPMAAECKAIHRAIRGNPLPLAQAWPESNYGKSDNAQATHNPLGLLSRPGKTTPILPVNVGGFTIELLKFATWSEAFAEWAYRMDTPGYKQGIYAQGMTLGQFIRTYVAGPGPGYANGESAESVRAYLEQTVARINRYYGIAGPAPQPAPDPVPGKGQRYDIPGLANPVHLPFPLEVRLMPRGQTNQRPGKPMRPDRYIQHDTDNTQRGAGAEAHWRYLVDGAPDQYGSSQQLSYHVTVDDRKAIVLIPFDEVAWHGGDGGGGVCNTSGISCELCVNSDRNAARAEENAAILAAEVMNAAGIADAMLRPHESCAGKFCPRSLLAVTGKWQAWARRVAELRRARQ